MLTAVGHLLRLGPGRLSIAPKPDGEDGGIAGPTAAEAVERAFLGARRSEDDHKAEPQQLSSYVR